MIVKGKIFKIAKKTCPGCGCSHLVGFTVGKTSYPDRVPSLFVDVDSPYYARSHYNPDYNTFTLGESPGGGTFTIVECECLIFIYPKWYAVGEIIHKTEIEPYHREKIPHPYQVWYQTGGDRGEGYAYEVKPLQAEASFNKLCKRCLKEAQQKKEE